MTSTTSENLNNFRINLLDSLPIAYRNIKAGEELTIDYGYEEIYKDCKCEKCKPKKKK